MDDICEILELLLARGAQVAYHDPHVPRLHKMRRHDLALASQQLEEKSIAQSDAAVIVTDHDEVDYVLVARHARLLLDTRSALRRRRISADPERTVLG